MDTGLRKVDKYIKTYNELIPFIAKDNVFKGLDGKSVLATMTGLFEPDGIRAIYAFYREHRFTSTIDSNHEDYEHQVDTLIRYVSNLLDKYVPKPITFTDGSLLHGTGSFSAKTLEFLSYHQIPEWANGSKFTCVIDAYGTELRKVRAELDNHGSYIDPLDSRYEDHIINSLPVNFEDPIALMGPGIYVAKNWAKEDTFVIRKENRVILKVRETTGYLEPVVIANYKNNPLKEEETGPLAWSDSFSNMIEEPLSISEDIDECSRCGGGGCPSCDTSGFFTGFRVYD